MYIYRSSSFGVLAREWVNGYCCEKLKRLSVIKNPIVNQF